MLDGGSNGIVSHEWRVHDDTKAFHLQVGLIQGLKGASIVKVVVKWDCKVRVRDGSDQHSMFSRGWE